VQRAIEWDIELAERDRRQRDAAEQAVNEFQADANRAATLRSLQRIDALIDLDEQDYNW
jgi:hypothetical protein